LRVHAPLTGARSSDAPVRRATAAPAPFCGGVLLLADRKARGNKFGCSTGATVAKWVVAHTQTARPEAAAYRCIRLQAQLVAPGTNM